MKAYIRTINGLVNMNDVQAMSWKSRKDAAEHDVHPFSILFFLEGGTTFITHASIKSVDKARERFKEMWTGEDEPLDISGASE